MDEFDVQPGCSPVRPAGIAACVLEVRIASVRRLSVSTDTYLIVIISGRTLHRRGGTAAVEREREREVSSRLRMN